MCLIKSNLSTISFHQPISVTHYQLPAVPLFTISYWTSFRGMPCLILEGVEHEVLPLLIGPWVMAMEGVLSEVLPGHETCEWRMCLHHLVTSYSTGKQKNELSRAFASRSVQYGRWNLVKQCWPLSKVSWSELARGTGGLCSLGEQLSHPNNLHVQGRQKEGFSAANGSSLR